MYSRIVLELESKSGDATNTSIQNNSGYSYTNQDSNNDLIKSNSEPDNYNKVLTNWQVEMTDGLKIRKIPPGMNPPLNQLDNLRSKQWQCLNEKIPSCTLGNQNSTKSVAVVGDSYALAIFPMVASAIDLNKYKIIGFFRGQCMIANVTPIINGKANEGCPRFRSSYFSYLQNLKPDLIVLSDLAEYEYLSNQGKPTTDYLEWKSHLEESFKVITGASKNVVYVTEPPHQSALVDCVNSEGLLKSSCFGVPSAGHARRQLGGSVAKEFSFHFVDTREWVCVFAGCPAIVRNTPVFWDGGHLSEPFASMLGPIFKSWLEKEGIHL